MAEFETEAQKPSATLSLDSALRRALAAHPDLQALAAEVSALEAEALQAGLLPNPELDVEIENVFGGVTGPEEEPHDLRGFTAAESTVQLSQRLELAGKRGKRRRLAEANADIAAWLHEARRLEIVAETRIAFVELLSAQQQAALNKRLVEIAARLHDTANRRVEAGKISPIEERRARVALDMQRAEEESARMALDAARSRMAAMWGGDPDFQEAVGDLENAESIPSVEALADRLALNPDVARWAAEIASRTAELDLAEAIALPDPTLAAGARYFNETENHAFLFGLSIPLPVFDRNQGGIAAARVRLKKAEAERRSIERELRGRLIDLHGRLLAARAEADRLGVAIIPEATRVHETLLQGFWLGEFDLIDVLDAEQRVFDLQARRIQALTEFHVALADLESLLGAPVNEDGPPSADLSLLNEEAGS